MKKFTQRTSRAVAMLLMMMAICLPQKMFAYEKPELGSDGYYQIATASNLAWFRDYVNASTAHASANARLTKDLDLGTDQTMIGTSSIPYAGIFDGNGMTLNVAYSGSLDCLAPFSYAEGATIKNLKVTGSVSSTGKYASGLIGEDINYASTISNCEVAADIGHDNCGGFIGYGDNSGSTTANITNSIFSGSLTSTNYSGCFVGRTYWNYKVNIKSCLAVPSSVSGGAVRSDFVYAPNSTPVTVTNSYCNGSFTETRGTALDLATLKSGKIARLLNGGDGKTEESTGLWGQILGTDNHPVFMTANKANAVYRVTAGDTIYYGNKDSKVTLPPLPTKTFFLNTKIGVVDVYTDGSNTYTGTYTFAAADAVLDYHFKDGYTDMSTLTETIDAKTYFKISTADQMKWFEYYVDKYNLNSCAKLMNDIDLSTVCSAAAGNWTPIAQSSTNMYNGVFDGNGKTISNLYIANATTDKQGLFGYTKGNAIIKNLNISGNVSSSAMNVELLVGSNLGKIIRCTSSGTVSGNGYTSGIAGNNSGSIIQCMNYASINDKVGITGGIAAYCNYYGTVTDCANFGTIKATTNGYTSTGGVVGQCVNTNTVKNCENLGQVYVAGALTEAYPILGTDAGTSTITNNYYLSESTTAAKYGTPKSAAQFKSGVVAHLLNGGDGTKEFIMGTWGQTFGTDNYPVFMTADKKNAVYKASIYDGSATSATSSYCNAGGTGLTLTDNQMAVLDSVADVSLLGTNVISSDNQANSIVLTDKKNFALPTGITAQSVTYTRDAYRDGYHETICLPFVPTTVPDDYAFSEYSSFKDDKVYFTDVTSLTAGKPYLMKYTGTPSSTPQTVTFSATNATVLAAPMTETKDVFVGDFSGGVTATNGDNFILGVYEGKEIFRKANTSYATIAFRAHLYQPYSAKENYAIDFGDDTTGISAAAASSSDGYIYDLQGRRIQIPVKGNVYIKNGKKFIY